MAYALMILFAYLSGSILWSKIIAKILFKKDIILENIDRNPGAYNVFKSCGVVGGIFALILDVAKGFCPIFISTFILPTENFHFSLLLIAPVLGHIFPVFNRFRGGRAIAVSLGVLLGIVTVDVSPLIFLCLINLFFSVIVVFASYMWRAVVTFVFFGFLSVVFVNNIYIALGCFCIAMAVFLKHFISRDKNDSINVTLFPRRREKK